MENTKNTIKILRERLTEEAERIITMLNKREEEKEYKTCYRINIVTTEEGEIEGTMEFYRSYS